MKILDFPPEPRFVVRYLNAGRGPGQFSENRLPVHVASVDRLPEGLAALIATADLQGRERFEEAPHGVIRLLGEALPRRLVDEFLPTLSLGPSGRIGVLLAGDFYTVPALDRRGGTGDVTGVWHAFANEFQWVAGVPGNHDTFGEPFRRPRLPAAMHLLDGSADVVAGLRIAGLGGIIGNTSYPNRRREEDYLATLRRLLKPPPDLLLMHDGPDGPCPGQRGLPQVREILAASEMNGLVIRGHAHWNEPLAEFENGLQVLNVHESVVVLVKQGDG